MQSQVEVTAMNYKQHVENMIREKVATVVWGGNASKVQEVFVFPEQFFCGPRVKKDVKELICQYLLENKFAFSIVVNRGKKQREWAMPLEPVQEPFISIRKECEEAFEKVRAFYDKKARDAIRDFASSKWRITVFKTDNSLYRQSIREQLLAYPNYIVCTTYAKDWVYPVKYGAPYNKLHEDYQRYVEFVHMHVRHFFDFLEMHRRHERDASMFYEDGKLCYREYKPADKFKIYPSLAVARDVALQMRKRGFDATIFPMHELSEYVEIGLKPYDGIPIYLEVKAQE